MAHAERAIERIYEDESLTDEMMDDEAKVLLRWSEDTVIELDEDAPDDETFDARFKNMRRLMKRINKFIGQRGNLSDEEAQEMAEKFRATAADMGYEISTERVQQFMAAQKALSNPEAVKAMLDLLKTAPSDADASETDAEHTGMTMETREKPAEEPRSQTMETREKPAEEAKSFFQNVIDNLTDKDDSDASDTDQLWDKRV